MTEVELELKVRESSNSSGAEAMTEVELELKVREFAWMPKQLMSGQRVWLRSVLAVYTGKNENPQPGGINILSFKGYEPE